MYLSYALLLILIIFISVNIKTRFLKASNIRLQELVSQRTNELLLKQKDITEKNEELQQQKEEMEAQRDELEHQNSQTRASLQYALTIQHAILPSKQVLDKYFDNFIFFKPRDVVSGDFYWFAQVPSNGYKKEKLIFAVVDCTGHGVPGGFMSMIGSRMLSEIILERGIHKPDIILTELNVMLNRALHQDSNDSIDGMDICLCSIDEISKGQYLVAFAGANRPLSYHKQGTATIGHIRGNRKTIGGVMPDIDAKFEDKLVDLKSGDSLFLYTDGYTDQNNEFGKKFSTSRLTNLFLSNIDKSMDEIGTVVANEFVQHNQGARQRDDITVIGLRLK